MHQIEFDYDIINNREVVIRTNGHPRRGDKLIRPYPLERGSFMVEKIEANKITVREMGGNATFRLSLNPMTAGQWRKRSKGRA